MPMPTPSLACTHRAALSSECIRQQPEEMSHVLSRPVQRVIYAWSLSAMMMLQWQMVCCKAKAGLM